MPSDRVPERVLWAVEQIAARETDRILEIGCGGGHAVALLCPLLPRGGLTAIDRSALQVSRARSRNVAFVAAGRARIEPLSLTEAPRVLGERLFTKALAINVNAFWTQPEASLPVVATLLRARGRAFLVYEPPTLAALRQVQGLIPPLLARYGFSQLESRAGKFRASYGVCFTARRA